MIVAVGDGPDYSGKSTTVREVAEGLKARGITVKVVNHPSNDTPSGQLVRRKILAGESNASIAAAFCEAFIDTHLEAEKEGVEVLLLDRYTPSTLVYQGDEGKEAVFASGILRDYAPDLIFALDVDYKTALERAEKRFKEQGKDWDSEVLTSRYISSQEHWDGLRDMYKRSIELHSKFASEIVYGNDVKEIVSILELMVLADSFTI